jgi:hypothetical protein
MKAIALAMLLASAVNADAFISSTDCRFGRGLGGCTTTVVPIPDAGPRIILVAPSFNAEREAQWEAFCKPTFAPTSSESRATSTRARAANTGEPMEQSDENRRLARTIAVPAPGHA